MHGVCIFSRCEPWRNNPEGYCVEDLNLQLLHFVRNDDYFLSGSLENDILRECTILRTELSALSLNNIQVNF